MRIFSICINIIIVFVFFFFIPSKVKAQYPTPYCSSVEPESTWTNKAAGSFTVRAKGVGPDTTRVKFPTWSEILGQDDLIWHEGVNRGGGIWDYAMELSQHPGEGLINTDVYMDNTWYTNIWCGAIDFYRDTIPPTCIMSGPATAVLGNSETYTGTASDTNLDQVYVWYSSTGEEVQNPVCARTVPPNNCSGEINFPAAGTYYVTCDAADKAQNECTGDPFGIPPGMSYCGVGSAITVTVITPTPFYYGCQNGSCTTIPGIRSAPYMTDCNGNPGICSSCGSLACSDNGDCGTQGGAACSQYSCSGLNCVSPTPTIYKVYGWVYKETNDTVVQAEEGSPGEPLINGITVDLNIQPITPAPTTYISSQVSSGSSVGGLNANYLFDPIDNGFYSVYLPITPTGYQLFNSESQRYTNPQIIAVINQDSIVNFPFVTTRPTNTPPFPTLTPSITPSGPTRTPTPSSTPSPTGPSVTPTATPTGPTNTPTATPSGPTLTPTRPISSPTPTSIWTLTPTPGAGTPSVTPIPTVGAGTPSPTPFGCQVLPTPNIQNPGWNICTNSVPQFSAGVADPGGNVVWAMFYSNMYPFAGMGTAQLPPAYGNSTWTVPNNLINESGTYWWSVFTESPVCPRSKDASAVPINFDFSGPPKPSAPTCTFVSQSISGPGADGQCRFSCTWSENLETNGTCANTKYYRPVFWTNSSDTPYYPTPAWRQFNEKPIDVYVKDGYEMSTQIQDVDNANPTPGAGNLSEPSNVGGPYICPKIIYPPTVTPGGPTSTPAPTATPTISPTPTITPTPTPGNWMQVFGGDVYKKSIVNPLPAPTIYFLKDLVPSDNSTGVVYSANNFNLGLGSVSAPDKLWQQIDANGLSNQYNFNYFWEAFKDTATPMLGNTVGDIFYANTNIYSYEGALLNLAPGFSLPPALKTAIFLIHGSLIIDSNITINSDQSLVFIVLGGIQVASNVTQIDGVYISSSTFSVTYSSNNLLINGMVYAKDMMLNRNNPSFVNPVYRIVYQPKYMFTLLPYLARQKVSFMEVAP